MKRNFLISIAALAAVLPGFPSPSASAAAIEVGGVSGGRHADPFLDAADGLVRAQGYRGDFAHLVGVSGLAGEATMCRHDCDCRETLHSAGRLRSLVAPLQGSVTRLGPGGNADTAWKTLETELKAGRPFLAEGLADPTSVNLVVGCDPETRTLHYLDGGKRRERSFAEWTRGNWSTSMARLGTTQVPGPRAEMDAVATMLVNARQPRIEGGCVVSPERTQNAVGLEAYSLWTERLKSEERPDPNVKGQRLQAWVERRGMLVKFLRTAASHQEGETARRLRDAADTVQREVDQGLKPLAATTPVPAPAGAQERQSDPKLQERQAGLMLIARTCRQQFLSKIEPVAFGHLRLPKEARAAASLSAAAGPVKPDAVRALLGSEDSRTRTLGALAAAGTGDKTLAPELTEGLGSADPVEARASLAALKAVKPDNLMGLLKAQMEQMEDAGGVVGGEMGAAGGGPGAGLRDPDTIQSQMKFAIEDLEGPSGGGGWARSLTRGPVLFFLAALVLGGLGAFLWKLFGPKRLAATLDVPEAPKSGLPAEAALLEALLAQPPATGLLLTHVAGGEMAEKQGLQVGDILVRYAGVEIQSVEDLRREAFKTGVGRREVAARRGRQTVKTVVAPGSLGVGGVPVTRGVTVWRRQVTSPFTADFSGFEEEGEAWYRLTRGGRHCGFERRQWRWVQGELEVSCVMGLAEQGGEESVRVTQRLRPGERLTCASTKFRAAGQRSFEADASCTGGRWIVLLSGRSVTETIPEDALPTHAMALFAATLPFEAGRAYDVVRVDEADFAPSYGCQIVCPGPQMLDGAGGDGKAWRFDLGEYGVRQMTFWFDSSRQLVRAEYAGVLSTRTTQEEALAGLPERLHALLKEPGRARHLETPAAEEPKPGALAPATR